MRRWLLLGLMTLAVPTIADDRLPFFLSRPTVELPEPTDVHASPLPPVERLMQPQTYPYGWFGAAPRRHWSRRVGLYRNYTQWSAR